MSTHSSLKPAPNRPSLITNQAGHTIEQIDPQLTRRFRESATITQHRINPSASTISGLSPIQQNPTSPSLILNSAGFPPTNVVSNASASIVQSSLAHTVPHKSQFPPIPESAALWDPITPIDPVQQATSASFVDIQSQFSRLLFNLLPSGPPVLPTPGPVTQTPGPLVATPIFDSFIHSPSPMSFPLSSERGLVVPSHAIAISSPTNGSSNYPPGDKTCFLRSLEEFDRGMLEAYIAECNTDISLKDFELPKKDALNRYLCAYFEGLHEHHPFIHTPTFNPVAIKGTSLIGDC